MNNKILAIITTFIATVSLTACAAGADSVELEYDADYDREQAEVDRELDIDDQNADYVGTDYGPAYTSNESEMLQILAEKLEQGDDFDSDTDIDEFDDDDIEHEAEVESELGELEYSMDQDVGDDTEFDIEAEVHPAVMQQTLTEMRQRHEARQARLESEPAPMETVRVQEISEQLADNPRVIVVEIEQSLADACGVQPNAYFAFDSAALSDDARNKLDTMASCLEYELPDQNIEVVGFADPRGSEEYNEDLGLERADSVADFLENEGLDRTRMELETLGETLAHENQPSLWDYDRRVEIRLDES